MNKKKIKQQKKLKKLANKAAPILFTPQAEFSNASPMRGSAYAVKGVIYGW